MMRIALTADRLRHLLGELSLSTGGKGEYKVFVVGGGTAVLRGWRESTIDADLYCEQEEVFKDIQSIKQRLRLNVEFVGA